MKKLFVVFMCFISMIIAFPVYAISFSPWVSYGTLSMGSVNTEVDYIKHYWEGIGITYGTTKKISSGIMAGIDIGSSKIIRLGYIPEVTGSWQASDFSGSVEIGYKASLLMAMVGKKIPLDKNDSINLGVFLGYGMALGSDYMTTNLSYGYKIPIGGGNVVGEIGILTKAGLSISYRYAVISPLTIQNATAVDYDGNGTTDVILSQGLIDHDHLGNALSFDFSGICFSMSF